jgi:D-arabinose 5-phosphate isomerase GutQ
VVFWKIPMRTEHCREEEYMMNSEFTTNVHYMTPSMAIMKLKHHNLKMV